jgi:hypothetical protein
LSGLGSALSRDAAPDVCEVVRFTGGVRAQRGKPRLRGRCLRAHDPGRFTIDLAPLQNEFIARPDLKFIAELGGESGLTFASEFDGPHGFRPYLLLQQ